MITNLIAALSLLLLVSCSKATLDGANSPHYFKNTVEVDHKLLPYHLYRMENKEVICYGTKNGGLQCQWKLQQ